MTVDVSRLGIEVESSGIKEATSDLDKLTQSATKAENATSNLKTSSTSLTNTQKTATSVADSLLKRFQQQVDLLGANTEKTFSYKAASKGLSDQQQAVAAQLGAQVDTYKTLVAQQAEAEKATRLAAQAAEAYAKSQGQANEMNKRFDVQQQIAALKELSAQRAQEERDIKAVIKAENDYATTQGQAIEMNKRIDRSTQAQAWRDLGKAQSEAIRINKQYDSAQASTIATTQRVEAQQRSFIAALKDQADTFNMTNAQLLQYRATQLGVGDQAAPFIKRMQDVEQNMGKVGISAKQTAFAFRMLPAQFSDIAVQLAGGQNPFLIMLQQGSQIKDSFGGLGNTFKALTSVITPARLALGLTAGAFVTLGYSAYAGGQEIKDFNKQMILTNGYAGLTTDQFNALSISIGKIQGGRNNAAKALTEIAGSGQIAAENIELVTKAAVGMQYNTGQAVEKTVAQFVAIEKDPVAAIQKLNDQYHFLTASVFEQISALEKQGDHEGAVKMAFDEYAKSIGNATPKIVENLGFIERAWKGIKDMATSVKNGAFDLGRELSSDDKIKQLQDRIESNKKSGLTQSGPGQKAVDNANALLQAQIDLIEADKRQTATAQQRQNEVAKSNKDAIEAISLVDKKLEGMKGEVKLQRELNILSKSYADIYKNNPNSDQLKGVNFDKNGMPTGGGDYQKLVDEAKRKDVRKGPTNEFDISQQLQQYQNLYKLEEKAFKSFSEQMKLQRDANTIDEVTYLDNLETAEQTSLQKRLGILEDEKGVAAKRKNKTQLERINGEIAALEQQLNDNLTKYGLAREKVWTKEEDALNSYVTSLQNAYNLRKRAVDDALIGTTLGDVAKGEMQRRLQLQREFDDKSNELSKQKLKGTISPDLYKKETDALGTEYQRRLELEDQYNADSASMRGDWTNGAIAALNQYREAAEDVAGQTKSAFTNAFSGMTDALTDFAMTGKLNFGSLTKSIIANIVKTQIAAASSSIFGTLLQIGMAAYGSYSATSATAGVANSGSTNGGFIDADSRGSFALGGAFDRGVQKFADGGAFTNGIVNSPTNFPMGQMGEAGPEAIVPLTRTSDGSLGVTMRTDGNNSSGPVSVNSNITIHNDGSSTTETTSSDQQANAKQFAQIMENVAKQTIDKEMRQGGSLWKMNNGKR